MMAPPPFRSTYTLTDEIVAHLAAIAEAKAVIEQATILPQQELRLRRQARVRMTHSSTAIEGNRLPLPDVDAVDRKQRVDAPARDVYEVQNYLAALKYIDEVVGTRQPLTEKVVLTVHRLLTRRTLPPRQSGRYRTGPVAVAQTRLGVIHQILYRGPAASQVPELMASLLAWVKNSEHEDIHPVIVAGILHQELAVIHPFTDGNGRTARALATLLLYQRRYDFRHLFALEDYYNTDRHAYYRAIAVGPSYDERRHDATPWLTYFVEGFAEEIRAVREKVRALARAGGRAKRTTPLYLTPKQLTVLEFLDHTGRMTVRDAVDILRCPLRTAQLELKRLTDLGILRPIGKGRATYYVLRAAG
jgi:cell filamentation protein, protein adenylyltransferase